MEYGGRYARPQYGDENGLGTREITGMPRVIEAESVGKAGTRITRACAG